MLISFIFAPFHIVGLWIGQRLDTAGNNTACPSLNSSYGNHCGEPGSGKSRGCLACNRIIFHRVDASVLRYVTRQVFPSSDRVISNLPNKPGNIRHEIHDPF